MRICQDAHEAICYDDTAANCPVCVTLYQLSTTQALVREKQREIQKLWEILEANNIDLESQL